MQTAAAALSLLMLKAGPAFFLSPEFLHGTRVQPSDMPLHRQKPAHMHPCASHELVAYIYTRLNCDDRRTDLSSLIREAIWQIPEKLEAQVTQRGETLENMYCQATFRPLHLILFEEIVEETPVKA